MKIAILGAGPIGMTLAYELSKNGIETDVFDKSHNVEGLAKSNELWGDIIETGPHFFGYSSEKPSSKIINQLFGQEEMVFYDRNTLILRDKRYFKYPPSISDIIKKIPFHLLVASFFSLIYFAFFKTNNKSAESELVKKIGVPLYSYLFRDYSEKIWGLPNKNLHKEYANDIIGSKSIWNYIGDLFKKNSSKHLMFYKGIGEVFNRMKFYCDNNGVKIHLNSIIKTVEVSKNKQFRLSFENTSPLEFDLVVSSLPLDVNLKLFSLPFDGHFSYRSLILVYLKFNNIDLEKSQCIFLFDKKIKASRLTQFDQFPLKKKSIYLLEYWVDNDTLLNLSEGEIKLMCENDLRQIDKKIIIEDIKISRIKNCYIIPNHSNYELHANKMKSLSNINGLICAGRNSSMDFNYGVERAMADAVYLSDNICGKL